MRRSNVTSVDGLSSSGPDHSADNIVTAELPTEEKMSFRPQQQNSNSSQYTDNYKFDGLTGWRRFRILRPGLGMYYDIRRRLPYYRSDISDAVTYRTVASTVRMYFVKFEPPRHC